MRHKLSPKQLRAVALIAAGHTGVAVAKLLGIKASTLSYWRHHHQGFITALDELVGQITRESLTHLQAALPSAVAEIQRIMVSAKADALRLKAAQFIIEAHGLPKSKAEAHHDQISQAELAIVGDFLKELGASSHVQ